MKISNPAMQAAFQKDFELQWKDASPQAQFCYAKGFHAGRTLPTVDIDLTNFGTEIKVDFDPTKPPSLFEIAKMKFDLEISPFLDNKS
jgi:hypothetical protein